MCGIIGILGLEPVAPALIEALKRLEYRGYDSAGIATLENGHLTRRRAEGKLRNLEQRLEREPLDGPIGIGQPLAVPILADLSKLPPLYIAVGEFDPLRDDSFRLAERAKAAGVPTEFRLWKGMVHGAIGLMGWIDAMTPEVDRIAEFLRQITLEPDSRMRGSQRC